MSSNNTSSASGGVGLFGLLGVAFIVLKLCKVITWSWWWVTAPFWAPTLLVIAILLVVFGVALVHELTKR